MASQFLRIALLTFVGAIACSTSFSEKDIANLKQLVKDEFSKRPGVTVTDVTFIKESDKKLTGLVNLKIGELEVTKSCNATMGEGEQYIWKCE